MTFPFFFTGQQTQDSKTFPLKIQDEKAFPLLDLKLSEMESCCPLKIFKSTDTNSYEDEYKEWKTAHGENPEAAGTKPSLKPEGTVEIPDWVGGGAK